MRMNFAQYYEVTDFVSRLMKEKKLLSYQEGLYKSVFICEDVHDYWVSRVQENMNGEYEREEGVYIIERNKIAKDNLCYRIQNLRENLKELENYYTRAQMSKMIASFTAEMVVESVLILDDEEGLSNWDYEEYDSYQDCLDALDDGFGINYSFLNTV